MRTMLHWIGTLLLVLLVTGCGGPSNADVRAFLETNNPEAEIISLNMRQGSASRLPGDDRRKYTIEFTAQVRLKEDILSQINANDAYRRCGFTDWVNDESGLFVYEVTAAKGSVVTAEGDTTAVWQEATGTWDFPVVLFTYQGVRGNRASVFTSPHVVVGTPAFEAYCQRLRDGQS